MKISTAILTLAFAITPFLNASAVLSENECSDLDIRNINPNIKELFDSPRSQGRVGWCYGFTAADLITAETGVKISAAHVSATFNKNAVENLLLKSQFELMRFFQKDNLYRDIYEGGFIGKAIEDVLKSKSVCSEKEMPFEKSIQFAHELDLLQRAIKTKGSVKLTFIEIADNVEYLLKKYNFSNSEVADIYSDLTKKNLNFVFEKILTENCKEKIEISEYQVVDMKKPSMLLTKDESKITSKKAAYLSGMNEALENGKPIGIGYNVKYIMSSNGGHASVVTGRRWNNGKCEYKVRNSWGQSCYSYNGNIECNQEEGSYWVDDSTLYDMLQSYTFIKKN